VTTNTGLVLGKIVAAFPLRDTEFSNLVFTARVQTGILQLRSLTNLFFAVQVSSSAQPDLILENARECHVSLLRGAYTRHKGARYANDQARGRLARGGGGTCPYYTTATLRGVDQYRNYERRGTTLRSSEPTRPRCVPVRARRRDEGGTAHAEGYDAALCHFTTSGSNRSPRSQPFPISSFPASDGIAPFSGTRHPRCIREVRSSARR